MSVLSDIVHGLEKFFGIAIAGATAAEPFVATVFPNVAPLFNTIVTEVAKAEAAAVAAGTQTGSGPQKLALVIAAVEGSFPPGTAPAAVTAAVNGVVAFLNAIPATTTTTAPAPAVPA